MVELNEYIEKLSRVPVDVRHFIGSIAKRMHRLRETPAVEWGQFASRIVGIWRAAVVLCVPPISFSSHGY